MKMKANEEKRREALKKIAALGAMAVFQPARAVPAKDTGQGTAGDSTDPLTVAIIGDPQYGFPSGTDPEPSLGNAIITFEDLKTVPHDFFVVLGDIIQPNNMPK